MPRADRLAVQQVRPEAGLASSAWANVWPDDWSSARRSLVSRSSAATMRALARQLCSMA